MTNDLAASICLASIDPRINRHRLYRLSWQPTLWGEGALMRWWGRRGSQGRSKLTFYPDQTHAQHEFQRLLRLRLRHGYQPQAWLGHKSLETTQLYVHLGRQNARKVMEETSL
jgi:predicted DNA-binding WGR domain protein